MVRRLAWFSGMWLLVLLAANWAAVYLDGFIRRQGIDPAGVLFFQAFALVFWIMAIVGFVIVLAWIGIGFWKLLNFGRVPVKPRVHDPWAYVRGLPRADGLPGVDSSRRN